MLPFKISIPLNFLDNHRRFGKAQIRGKLEKYQKDKTDALKLHLKYMFGSYMIIIEQKTFPKEALFIIRD